MNGFRVRFAGGLTATIHEGVWTVPDSEALQFVLNAATADLTRGPSYGFNPDWAVANIMARRQGGQVLETAPPMPPEIHTAPDHPLVF